MNTFRRPASTLDRLRLSNRNLQRPSAVYLKLYTLSMQREHLQNRTASLRKQLSSLGEQTTRLTAAIDRLHTLPRFLSARQSSEVERYGEK